MANFRWFTKLHRNLYHFSGGRIGANLGQPMTLLYTRGARSGRIRRVPLVYYPLDPEGIIILASNNGSPKPPAWWFNLRANPELEILVGTEKRRVIAEEVEDSQREQLWGQMVKRNPMIRNYPETSGRKLPIIRLRTLSVLKVGHPPA